MSQYLRIWTFDPTRFRDISWWHWLITLTLLADHLATRDPIPLYLAMCLCAAMGLAYLIQFQSPRAWPVQIRFGFLVLLAIGLLPDMGWVYPVALVGQGAMLLVGYCAMHRLLLMMPWNREHRLSWRGARRTIVAPPGAGGLFRYGATGLPVIEPACG
jgi:hypothetical protein